MIRILLVSSLTLFVLSCSPGNTSKVDESSITVELNDISLNGVSFRANGEKEADWTISILNKDSIILLVSTVDNLRDEPSYNHQLYAKLIPSSEFDFEIVPSIAFYGLGCSKPFSPFLYSDSLPLNVDSLLLPYFQGSKVQIQSNAGTKTEITINSSLNIFRTIHANGDLDTSEYRMTFTPSSSFKFHPFTLRTGDRCAASISANDLQIRYFLSKTGKKYQLVIDKREYYRKTDCKECIETIDLERI